MVVSMIENVYPIRGDKTDGTPGRSRKLPRNIRACGQGGGPVPVYIEDYVSTYIRRLAESGFPECSAVVLVGQVMDTEIGRCLFVRGGVNANRICVGDKPVFDEDVWNEVYEKIRMYFPDDEVVGWCVAGPGFRLLQEGVFLRAHIDNFADCEKVFICYESLEKEFTLRCCMGGAFCVLPGYYIYYEKNDEMQSYMLEEASFARKGKKKETAPENEQQDYAATEPKKLWVEEPDKNKIRKEKGESVKKDILQLVAIACIIVLIVSVMMGTDALSLLKESTFADGEKSEENLAAFEDAVSVDNPEEFAFRDFDFLEDNKETGDETREVPVAENEDKTEEIAEGTTGELEQENDIETGREQEDETKEDVAENTENPDKIEEETVTVLSPGEYISYTVKSGDTLAGICMEIYGSVELLHHICELNQLKDIDSICAGQELIFPK